MSDKSMMPVIFFGHGSPLNAVAENDATRAWRALGQQLPRPRAVLCISAHWYIRATRVTAMERPRTIHDFGGFPPALYRIDYPAPGAPALAARVQALLAPVEVSADTAWGLDHGCWSVLRHVYPQADVPVVQLAIDATQPAAFHLALGQRLAPLRRAGVLIVASGGLVHDLASFRSDGPAPDWAVRAEQALVEAVQRNDRAALADYPRLGEDVMAGVPTPDHYLPLLYALGASGGPGRVLCRGLEGGSVSLLSVQFDD